MSILMNRLKLLFFDSKYLKLFLLIYRMVNRNYKNKNTERKYLKIMQKTQFLKFKNSLFEFERDFIDLEDIQLKDREIKIKVEIEELFL